MVAVLKLHEGLAHTFARHGSVFRAANGGGERRVGVRIFERAHLKFDAQNPPHRIVNARQGNALVGH